MEAQSVAGPRAHRIFISRGDGEYRVVPPMPVVHAGDTVTFVNMTDDQVLVRFPDGLMTGGVIEQKIGPRSQAPDSATIDDNAVGQYFYIVAVVLFDLNRVKTRVAHGFVLARGSSSPGMIVDY